MKRIISIMLAIFMVMSAFVFVPVSGEEVALNEDADVIEVRGDAVYNFGETFSGYLKVSADLYLTTEVTYAEIDTCKDGIVGKTKVADTKIKNEWQTVSVYLSPGTIDGLKFISTGLMLVNNIRVGKIPEKQLVYDEDFEGYSDGENVKAINTTKLSTTNSTVIATAKPITEFKAVSGKADSKVATLYSPLYSSSEVKRVDDDGETDPLGRMATRGETGSGKIEGMEYYTIGIPEINDAEHVMVEMDLYNAGNSIYGGNYADQIWISLVQNDYKHTDGGNIQGVKVGAREITVKGYPGGADLPAQNADIEHGLAVKTWNKLTLDFKRESYIDSKGNKQWHVITSAKYGDAEYTNHSYTAKGENFNNLVMSMGYNHGGRYYIDNLKVYAINDIENKYIARYEENFDERDYKAGETPDGFALSDKTASDTTQYTTFTVEDGIGENGAKAAKLYNRGYTYTGTDVKRYKADGLLDYDAVLVSDGNTEFFTISVPGLEAKTSDYVGMKKKTRLSFKYYLAGGAMSEKGSDMDALRVALMVNRLNNDMHSSGQIKIDSIGQNSAKVWGKNAAGVAYADLDTRAGAKTWVPVAIEIDSECKIANPKETAANFNRYYTHEVNYTVGNVSQKMSFEVNTCYDINRLMFGIAATYGGIVYIDDILAETNYTGEDFDEDNTYYEIVYSKSFDLGSSNITKIELTGPSVLVYGQNNNTYSYSAKVVNLNGEEQIAEVIYSLEGDVPDGVILSGNTITVSRELPKDKQITLKAQISGTDTVATKKITFQDRGTYLEDKRRFNVLLDHIDNIYEYAGDKINNSALLGLVVDRATMAPGYWPHMEKGELIEYMPSDLASMGNFLRAVDTVGFITGDKSYNEKVNDIYELWLEKYLGDNGLPYWGAHTCADMLTGGKDWGSNSSHELKSHYPYMEPFFRVNPKAAQQICIQAWGEHVKDWDTQISIQESDEKVKEYETMHFNRHGRYVTSAAANEKEFIEKTKEYKLSEPGYKAAISTDIGFASIAGDLGQLASTLIKNTNGYDTAAKNAFISISDAMWKVCDPDPDKLLNISQNSTAGRYGYPDAAPGIKDINKYEKAAHLDYKWWLLPDISLNYYELTTTSYGDRWWHAYGDDMLAQDIISEDKQWIVRECFSKFSGAEEAVYPFLQGEFVEAAGPETEQGRIVLERALRAHANHIRMAYNENTNQFDRIFADGTKVTGLEMTRTFYGSTKGSVFRQYDAGYAHLLGTVYNYLNAVRYEEYNDESVYPEYERDKEILWNYIRNYMNKKGFGNLGTTYPGENISLNFSSAGADPRIMLSMIYLYQATGVTEYLDMARCVADNIIKQNVVNGMFTSLPQNRYIFIGGENGTYPYAFALLEATIRGEEAKVPVYFPNSGFREDVYYDEDIDTEYVTRYCGYVYDDTYSGLETSVEDFKQIQVNNETKTITFDADTNISAEASIKVMFVSGSEAEIKVYNNEGEEIYRTNLDPSIKNRRQKINISAPGESIKSISFKTDGLVLVESIVVEKFYKADKVIYEEDFEGFDEGEKINTYTVGNYYNDQYIKSTFTAAENVGDNSSMAGCIYNPGYYFQEIYRVDDDGNEDTNAVKTSEGKGSASDGFTIPVDIEEYPNLRLEFKYYIGGNSRVQDINGLPRDVLRVGIVQRRLKHAYASEVAWASFGHKSAAINNRVFNESSGKYEANSISRPNNNGEKEWHDAAFEVKRVRKMIGGEEKLCAEIAMIVDGEKTSSVVEGLEDLDTTVYGNIALAVDYLSGGKVYIDDIKLYSLSEAGEDTESILGKNFVKLKGAPCTLLGVDGFENLKAGDLSSVILRKSSDAMDNLSVVTALYKNDVLEKTAVNQVNLSGMELYKDTKINLSEIITVPENHTDYKASVMLFETLDKLIPLANKYDLKNQE